MAASSQTARSRATRKPKAVGIHEAADRLGVHYMTVYRYIRTGRLAAVKEGGEWRIQAADLDKVHPGRPPEARGPRRGRAREGLEERLVAGDEVGAWTVIQAALTSGADPADIHLDLIAPALRSIGQRWASGELDVADEHLASSVARRLIGRLGPRFARPGRKRGVVVVGAPPGELHDLPVAIVADQLRGAGLEVVDLGGSTPAQSFAVAVRRSSPLAVLLGVTGPGHDSGVREVVAAVRAVASIPILVGGAAVPNAGTASELGADGWTGLDAPSAVSTVEEMVSG
jgi:MerR family transcriptional regulator, light-induced transcriptional regulator